MQRILGVGSCLILVTALHQPCAAQRATAPTATMDEYFTRLALFGGSGAVVATRDGRTIYRRGFGSANEATNTPMTAAMGVDIASMTKDLTVIAILQLVERGKLRLADSLYALLDSVPAEKRDITIEQLLGHRSGLPSYFVEGNDFTPLTRAEALHAILGATLLFAPGEGSEYSDAGFVLLAIILERITGQPLEEWFLREQYRRAGLRNTDAYGSAGLRRRTDLAHGYVGSSDEGTPARYVQDGDYWVVKGAGGVVSTVDDIAAWEFALRTGRFLSPSSLQRWLAASDTMEFGSSSALEPLPSGRKAWVRTGAQDFGFAAGAIRYQADTTIVAVAVNRQPEGMDVSRVRNRLLTDMDAFVFGTPPAMPPSGRPLGVSDSLAAGVFVLADSSTLRVERQGDHLLVTPDGPLSVELLSFPIDTAGRAHRLALAVRTVTLLKRLCLGDPSLLQEAMARASERIEKALTDAACADSATRIRAIGSVPRWWTQPANDAPATLVEFTTSGRTRRMRFEWEGDRLAAVGGGAIEAPVTWFLATPTPHEYIGFNLGIRAPVRLTLPLRPP